MKNGPRPTDPEPSNVSQIAQNVTAVTYAANQRNVMSEDVAAAFFTKVM